jgi:hypothetical protein
MSRRLTTFVLAAFYLLQATWLLHAGVDLLLPTVREAASTVADSCCSNACGCPEEVKAVQGCCCIKTDEAPQHPTSRHSAIEEARCKGVEQAMAQALTQPVVCGFAAVVRPVVAASSLSLPDIRPSIPHFGTSLDKVPIA